jgi:transcription initiation factor IIE alpha subunit
MKKIVLIAAVLFSSIACNVAEESKVLKVAAVNDSIQYQCPMKDQQDTTYTTTGECPKCGMELEIKKLTF